MNDTTCGLIAKSCLTLCDPLGWNLPGFSGHGISQARILEWVAISFSKGSSWSRDWTHVSCITGEFFTNWATGNTAWVMLKMLRIKNKN